MNANQIKSMQAKINAAGFPLKVDGFWGPRSQACCRAYLRSLMPFPNPWPLADSYSLRKFYGEPGDESNLVTFVPSFEIFYDGKLVRSIRCHKKVAQSLARVLDDIKGMMPTYPDIVDDAQDYAGCFNFRQKRGGSSWSLHAWGAAIDLDADDNTFRDTWPIQADMPLEIMEAFAREGWISAGAFWGYDAMHFQATR